RRDFHKRRIEGRLLKSKLHEGILPPPQPGFSSVFFGRQSEGAFENLRRNSFMLDLRRKSGRESAAEGSGQAGQLNAALMEKAAARPTLGRPGDLAAAED